MNKNDLRKILVIGIMIIFAVGIILPLNSNSSTASENRGVKAPKSPYVNNTENYCSAVKIKGLTVHDPININGNGAFTSYNGVTSGSGTKADPYIIENWDINAGSADGIVIQNTDAYFIIKNCYIHDGKTNDRNGICFYSVINGKIDNYTSENNNVAILTSTSSNSIIANSTTSSSDIWGIYIGASNNFTIINCTSSNNGDSGIELRYGSNHTIINCNFQSNSKGIILDSSSNNELKGNILKLNTHNFGVLGDDISHFYQNIDTSNTINGKPIYYIVEQETLTFDETISIGYLGLVSCKGIVIKNLSISKNREGILFANTTDSAITNCTFSSNNGGILFYNSYKNSINNCTCSDGWYGTSLRSSSNNNTITSGNFSDNGGYGIFLKSSSDNQMTDCLFKDNTYYGVYPISNSSNNTATNCTIYYTTYYTQTNDIYLDSSSHVFLLNTSFNKNKIKFNDALSNLTVKWYIHIKIVNSTNDPIPNANVRVTDNENGTFDQNYVTDSSGWIKWVECIECVRNQTVAIYYTPHNITASKTLYKTNYSNPTMDTSKEITIKLSKSDTTPPSVSSTTPANGTVLINEEDFWKNVTVIFDEEMNTSTVNVANNSDALGWTKEWSSDNKTLYLNHSTKFSNHTHYWFNVTGEDKAGNSLASGYYNFTFEMNTTAEVDASVSGADIEPYGAVLQGYTYNITATIHNIGKGKAGITNANIYVDGNPLGIVESFPQTIDEGESITIHSVGYEIPKKDNITIRVVIEISDINSNNNDAKINVQIVNAPPAPVPSFSLNVTGLLITISIATMTSVIVSRRKK